jgi:hypothetical protein
MFTNYKTKLFLTAKFMKFGQKNNNNLKR